jgi:hypothetical protein
MKMQHLSAHRNATTPVKRKLGVLGMKNVEKGAATIFRPPLRCPRVFAIFLQPKFPSCRRPTKAAKLSSKQAAKLYRLEASKSTMPFLPSERTQLLGVKGVGTTVIARLEQMGFESFAHLRKANALDILSQGAKLTGSSCWKNSPQARAAINAAIGAAIAAQNLTDKSAQ